MLEKITQWHQSRIQKRLIHAYRVFMGVSLLPLVLTGLTHGPVVLAICLLTSQVFFGAIAYAYYRLQRTRVRESAFALDRIFDGHDFFPTTLEYQQTPGVVGEQFMELAHKRLDAIVSESPLINLSRELLRTAVYGLILLILLLLVPPMVNAVRSMVSGSGSTGQSEGQEDSENQQDKGSDKESESETESDSSKDPSEDGKQAGQDNSKDEKSEEELTPKEGEGSEQGQGSEGEKNQGDKSAQDKESDGQSSEDKTNSAEEQDASQNQGQSDSPSPTAQAGTGQTTDPQTPKQPQSTDPAESQAESEKTSDPASTKKPTGKNELNPSSTEKQVSQGQGDVDAGDPVQEEIEKIQAMTVHTVKIESVKQKLEGIVTRPGVPRKYRDKLKKMFENKERFPGSN